MSLLTSMSERQELTIGTVIFAVCNCTSYLGRNLSIISSGAWILGSIIAGIIGGFIYYISFLAGKYVAKRNGIDLQFKLIQEWAFLSLITALIPIPMKFIAPGLSMFRNEYVDEKQKVKILSVGPLVIWLLSGVLLIIESFLLTIPITNTTDLINVIIFSSVSISCANMAVSLAFFLLIPFYFMNGEEILHGNKVLWACLFILSLYYMVYLYWAGSRWWLNGFI